MVTKVLRRLFQDCFFEQFQTPQSFDPDMTDSSTQSDDTSSGGNISSSGSRQARGRSACSNGSSTTSRRKKGVLNAKERNLRRLESNERERMRMHSLNDAFQVSY